MDAVAADYKSSDLDSLWDTKAQLPIIDISPQVREFALNVVHGYVEALMSPGMTTPRAWTIAAVMSEAEAKAGVTISKEQRLEFGLDEDMPCIRPAYRYLVNGKESPTVPYVFQQPKVYQYKPPEP